MRKYWICVVLMLVFVGGVFAQDTAEPLALVGTFDGECASFDRQSTVMATTMGVFDLETGEQRIDVSAAPVDYAETIFFSPDNQWVKMGDSFYAVETGELALSDVYEHAFIALSENGQWAHIHGLTYDTATWQTIDPVDIPDFAFFEGASGQRYVWRDITSGNGIPTYLSAGSHYWVHITEGIYDVESGELIDVPEQLKDPAVLETGVFSPDDSLFFVGGEFIEDFPVYRTPSFEHAYDLTFDMGYWYWVEAVFSSDNRYFGVPDNGIYDMETGERLFEITGELRFSPDSALVGTSAGLFDLPGGDLVMAFDEGASVPAFSSDSALIAGFPYGVVDVQQGSEQFGLDDPLYDVAFRADDSLLFAVTMSLDLLIYDVASGELLQTLPAGHTALWSSDEQFLSLTLQGECLVYRWTLNN